MKGMWHIRCVAGSFRRRLKAFEDLLAFCKMSTDYEVKCPICDRSVKRSITFGRAEYVTGLSSSLPEVQTHQKHLCSHCGHFFTPWLDTDLGEIAKKYQGIYAGQLLQENERAAYQLGLIRLALDRLGGEDSVRILDFGCGPNTSPTRKMREAGYDVCCCDIIEIYPYDGDVFFRHDLGDTRWFGQFDAIVSIDVIEHLGNTVCAWRHLNQLLKRDGIMLHCFPTRLHYGLRHTYCATPFHTCIFSKKSLRILMDKTGFTLEAVEPFDADVPYVFIFRKTAEISEAPLSKADAGDA